MIMRGKLLKGPAILKDMTITVDDSVGSYQDRLEQSLVAVCKALSVSVPMWLSKNTREYVTFRRTFFNADQFNEVVLFDKMEIVVEE